MGPDDGAPAPGTAQGDLGVARLRGPTGAGGAKLVCYSGAGFTADLEQTAGQENAVRLVTVDDLYPEQSTP
jgi:hypothetical protein